MIRLTPRLSRRRANSVCGSWGTNDICFGQELVRDEAPRSNSDPERVASGCGCRDRGKQSHFVILSLRRSCIQVFHVVDYFCSLRISFCTDWVVGVIKIRAGRTAPRPGDRGCHHHPCTRGPADPHVVARHDGGHLHR